MQRGQRSAFETRRRSAGHTIRADTKRWECAELSTIIREIFAPYRTSAADRVRLEGAPVRSSPTAALTLAMILNQLATNAAKYGSLSVQAGKLDVSWGTGGLDGSELLWLNWFESDGPAVSPPKHRGFGTRFLERGVAQQLQGGENRLRSERIPLQHAHSFACRSSVIDGHKSCWLSPIGLVRPGTPLVVEYSKCSASPGCTSG